MRTTMVLLILIVIGCGLRKNDSKESHQTDPILSTILQSDTSKYCSISERIDTTNGLIRRINEEEFLELKRIYRGDNPKLYKQMKSDSLENFCQLTYPHIFNLVDSCYRFQGEHGEFQICSRTSKSLDFTERTYYEFISMYCDKVIINTTAYESWSYQTIDLKSGKTYTTLGEPNFISCDTYYSLGNYYGEEEISLVDAKAGNQITVVYSDHWQSDHKASFSIGDTLVVKLFKNNCRPKYYSIALK